MTPISNRFVFDDATDSFTLDGIRFSGPAMDFLLTPTRPGLWFRISKVTDVVIIESKQEEVPK